MAKKAKKCFPGDPRFSGWISPSSEDISALPRNAWLSTLLLDCILQRSAPPVDVTSTDTFHIGSLGTRTYIQSCNDLITYVPNGPDAVQVGRANRRKVSRIRASLQSCFRSRPVSRLLIPIVLVHHFFVLCLDCSFSSREFITNLTIYDSLQRRTRQINPDVATIVKEVNYFVRFYILQEEEHEHLRLTDEALLKRVEYGECPRQLNGFDCGLFAVGIVLHLVEGKVITMETFTQQDITGLRAKLTAVFGGEGTGLGTTSQVVRACFPKLNGSSILDTFGVEVLDVPAAEVHQVRSAGGSSITEEVETAVNKENTMDTAGHLGSDEDMETAVEKCASLLDATDDDSANGNEDALSYHTCEDSESSSEVKDDNVTDFRTGNEGSNLAKPVPVNKSPDVLFYDIMRDAKVDCFATLEEVMPLIETYEIRSGNHLRVQRSLRNQFKQFQCREHVDCPFQILISRRRSDGRFGVSKIKGLHGDVRRAPLAADGRHWKKRHPNLHGIIGQVVQTKEGTPTPADVQKTAATRSGLIVPYMTAYRALTHETSAQKAATLKNFEMIVPFLEALKSCNPDSIIGCERDKDMRVVELHVFPGIMNRALKFVRPVLSLDAAHLKSVFKGTLYVASVLTGSNDIFPIGFMISAGNEDGASWRKMLRYLKKACPIIGEQVYGNVDVDGVARPPFLFISDRDKGLKPALKAVFPDKFEMSCAKHIEGNVAQKFGKQCSKYVLAIAKTFSTRNSSRLFEEVRRIKPEAATYLDEITDKDRVLWRTTQWYSSSTAVVIPPRYGIVTSNTSEAVNNMFSEARDLGWLECVNKLIDIMSTRIYVCRKKYSEREGSEVVPRVAQIMKVRWDAAASMTVVELESGCGDFKVVEPSSLAEDDLAENTVRSSAGYLDQNRINIVKPDLQWCSCGVWQDFLYPCRHACAVFRKWKEKDFTYVIGNLVHPYYSFEFVQNTFRSNVFPVCLETLEYDGVTKEPALPKRQAGRPKTKRIRRRSKFVELKQSPVTCSICGKRGHNRRSCVPSVQKGAKSNEIAPVSNSV